VFELKRNWLVLAALAVSLTACGDKEEANLQSSSGAGAVTQVAVTQASVAAKTVENKNEPDPRVPPSDYINMTDEARDSSFLYMALSDPSDIESGVYYMTADDDDETQRLAFEYVSTKDAFRKKEIFEILSPKIEERIKFPRRYGYIEIPSGLNSYDFDRKGFVIDQFDPNKRGNVYYRYKVPVTARTLINGVSHNTDMESPRILLINSEDFSFLPVQDTPTARKIEEIRSGKQGTRLRIYFYVQESKKIALQAGRKYGLSERTHKSLITRVQWFAPGESVPLIDYAGN